MYELFVTNKEGLTMSEIYETFEECQESIKELKTDDWFEGAVFKIVKMEG